MDVPFYLAHHEPSDGPCRRLKIEFNDKSYCVILFNLFAVDLITAIAKKSPSPSKFTLKNENLVLDIPIKFKNEEYDKRKVQSWFVYAENNELYIHTKSSSALQVLPLEVGYVITGKQNLIKCLPIANIRILSKQEPTPLIADEVGDDFNDSFHLEPRIIESIPSTVFSAVEKILAIGKRCFNEQKYVLAAEKYKKAFHYCHTYFPEDLETSDLLVFTDLKIRSLLNLALTGLKTGNKEWYKRTIESCDFLLGMPEILNKNQVVAKVYYRRGFANMLLGDEDLAELDFKRSLALVQDVATIRAIEECNLRRKQRQERLRKKIRLDIAA